MLSAAIVVYALRPVTPIGTAPATQTIVQKISDTEIQARVDSAVAKAVAQVEERQTEKTKTLVSEVESMRQRLQVAAIEWDMDRRRNNTHAVQNAGYVGPHDQENR